MNIAAGHSEPRRRVRSNQTPAEPRRDNQAPPIPPLNPGLASPPSRAEPVASISVGARAVMGAGRGTAAAGSSRLADAPVHQLPGQRKRRRPSATPEEEIIGLDEEQGSEDRIGRHVRPLTGPRLSEHRISGGTVRGNRGDGQGSSLPSGIRGDGRGASLSRAIQPASLQHDLDVSTSAPLSSSLLFRVKVRHCLFCGF